MQDHTNSKPRARLLTRNPLDYLQETPRTHPIQVRSTTLVHPHQSARQYTRALNAAKLDRLFAKPFVRALEGHQDGVYRLCKWTGRLDLAASASADGEIRLWDVKSARTLWRNKHAHEGFIHGLCSVPTRQGMQDVYDDSQLTLISAGFDRRVHIWRLDSKMQGSHTDYTTTHTETFTHTDPVFALDHHWEEPKFATGSVAIDVWSHERSRPVSSHKWGADSIRSVRWNPSHRDLFGATGNDRSVVLLDDRMETPVRKVLLLNHSNAISWNPMEPFNFVVANDDSSAYLFDMRQLSRARGTYRGHTHAVMDVDFSPTGQELATTSFDRTIRIFGRTQWKSRDVYFQRRMARGFAVRWMMDDKFILSGTDDGNVRVWKVRASERLGPIRGRERQALNERETLKQTYGHLPEIKRVLNHRHLPKKIMNLQRVTKDRRLAEQRREERRRNNPGSRGTRDRQDSEKKKKSAFVVTELE